MEEEENEGGLWWSMCGAEWGKRKTKADHGVAWWWFLLRYGPRELELREEIIN